ncbi:MAG TPA: sensor histidine kinase [Segeticoccus sp.]|uniref:sensor histidine kinase n=1 Tax=Segeticoccus sp. TaxID=2706531 RepID=UPI002D7E9F14|nr:sensor histidine kinase [Segeticoccus sp.]HET8600509.1 sensor histidine kinase [Segeticoccus sp.]
MNAPGTPEPSEVPGRPGLVHRAGFYASDDEYRRLVGGFISAGLSKGEPTLVVLPPDRLELVQQDLGPLDGWVELADMRVLGRNPGRVLPNLRRFSDAHPGRPVRAVGEPAFVGRTATEYLATSEHEALVNVGLAGRPVTALCPFNVRSLPPQVVEDARATHPVVWEGGREHTNHGYQPESVLNRCRRPLPAPADAVDCVVESPSQLSATRRLTSRAALRLGLPMSRLGDLEFVVTELASNSLVHTEGAARVQVWREADAVVCAVSDAGCVSDPMAGRRLPEPGQQRGRGLRIVHELADLVRLCPRPEGTTVQVHLSL